MKETQKAVKNFPLSYSKVNMDLIRNIIRIKRAAAIANLKAKKISGVKSKAIVKACKKGIRRSQFPISALQGGAGTSINMNVNEVIAKMAKVDSLDHVNLSQSTNDVCSSALRITSYLYLNNLIESLGILIKEFNLKTKEFKKVKKLSRTHLQDAVPTTLGKEFKSYADILKEHLSNLKRAQSLMLVLNLGGAAIGEGNNTGNVYVNSVYKEIKNITGVKFILAKNLMAKTSSLTDFLIVSQAVVALSVDLSKIANDFRLMSSGPRGGFGEILLPRLQKGSSIMPGKVNPVVSELVNQWHFLVSGNNLMIEKSAEAGQLELNTMFPLLADKLLESLKLSDEVVGIFGLKCVRKIKADKKRCLEHLENSTALSVKFISLLGYKKVEEIVKKSISSGKSFKELIIKSGVSEKEWRKRV